MHFSWSKNLSNLVPVGSRLCEMYIYLKCQRDVLNWKFYWIVVMQHHSHFSICPIQNCPWAKRHVKSGAGGCQIYVMLISEIAGQIHNVQSCAEWSIPVVVQHHNHLPIAPHWLASRPKTCQIWCQCLPKFYSYEFPHGPEHISDGWIFAVRVFCIFATYRPKKGAMHNCCSF